jgi:hypothetical protein
MKLIDRYITEVSDRLPEKMRDDLSKEIRSLIEDTLEDRASQTGKSVDDEALVTEVLKSFGSPAKMASSYLPPRYLIGPRLFPIFWLVLRIVLGIAALVVVVQLGVTLAETATSFADGLQTFLKTLGSFLVSALTILGNIVFIFAIIEWLLPKVTKEQENSWDPRSMDDRKAQDKVTLAESIAGVVFTLIVILLFNLYPQWVGIGFLENGKMVFNPILTDAFFKFLPALNILWILELVKGAILIREGKWTRFTRWMGIGLNVAAMAIALVMAFGAPIAALPANHVFASDPELMTFFNYFVAGILIVIGLANGIEAIRSFFRVIKK